MMAMPPDYGETNPPVNRGKIAIAIPAWAWAVGVGLLIQCGVSLITQDYKATSMGAHLLVGAGLRDWLGEGKQNNKQDDIDS